jgi:large subunit ribosomal protein L21
MMQHELRNLTKDEQLPQCSALLTESDCLGRAPETVMYAIIDDSGTQFKVTSGDRIKIDRAVEEGTKTVTFEKVLMVGGDGAAKIGQPLLAGATVVADVIGAVKGPKVVSVKYRRRKGFHKKIGHRQKYTEVKITAINA